jgi:hypothetical protein
MNQEELNRREERQAEEEVERFLLKANLSTSALETFQNNPEIKRKMTEIAKSYGLSLPGENQTLVLHDILGRLLPDVDYYVTDVLRAKGYITIIGRRKKGKSLLAMQLALSLSAGREWLTMRVKPEGVAVLYLNYEISHEKFLERIQDISIAMGIPVNDNFMFRTVDKIPLDTPEGKVKLSLILHSCPKRPQVIVLDPRYGFMAGDENQTIDMTLFVDSLKQLENMLDGISFIVVAHAGKDEGKGARGNSVFEDGAETLMTLRDVKNKNYKKELDMTGRDLGDETLALDLNYPLFAVKSPESTDTPKIEQAKEFILEWLNTRPDDNLRKNIVRAGGAHNWSTNLMHRALDRLKSDGLITIEPAPGMAGNHKLVKLVNVSVPTGEN